MKGWLAILIAGCLGVFLLNLTRLQQAPDARLLDLIALGMDGHAGVQAWLVAFAFDLGGLATANWARNWFHALVGMAVTAILVVIVAFLARRGPCRIQAALRFGLAIAACAFLLWSAMACFQAGRWAVAAGEHGLPVGLLEVAVATSGEQLLLASPAAARHLRVLFPGASVDADTAAFHGMADPAAWRQRDREFRYGAVVLSGPVADFRPLLDHLVNSPDWQAKWIDEHGFLFVRGLEPGAIEPVWNAAETGHRHSVEGALRLARAAANIAAAGYHGEARSMFRDAIAAAPERPEILALQASFLASRDQWHEAAETARMALRIRPDYFPALQVMVQAELASERPGAAWSAAETLKRLAPRDPYSLFLHARAANAAGAYFAEVDSLQRLIRLSRGADAPFANYLVYLGQAHARQGHASMAIESWEEAIKSGHLAEAKIREVEDLIQRVREQAFDRH